ncbi:hypothetical protein [Devosia sp.]
MLKLSLLALFAMSMATLTVAASAIPAPAAFGQPATMAGGGIG